MATAKKKPAAKKLARPAKKAAHKPATKKSASKTSKMENVARKVGSALGGAAVSVQPALKAISSAARRLTGRDKKE